MKAMMSNARLTCCGRMELVGRFTVISGGFISEGDERKADQGRQGRNDKGNLLGGADATFAAYVQDINGKQANSSEQTADQHQAAEVSFAEGEVIT